MALNRSLTRPPRLVVREMQTHTHTHVLPSFLYCCCWSAEISEDRIYRLVNQFLAGGYGWGHGGWMSFPLNQINANCSNHQWPIKFPSRVVIRTTDKRPWTISIVKLLHTNLQNSDQLKHRPSTRYWAHLSSVRVIGNGLLTSHKILYFQEVEQGYTELPGACTVLWVSSINDWLS